MKNLFRKITALVLSLCLIVGMTGLTATAYAKGLDDGAVVAADKEALAISFSVTDSVYGLMSVTWEGDGTVGAPYQVSSPEHLADISNQGLDKHYIQTANINLSSIPNWTSFGTYAVPFISHYDGGGYVISGLTVTGSNSNASLFGFVSGNAVIKNVRIENASVAGGVNVGILAGIIADGGGATGGGTIENCSTSGTVSGSARVGGLIGAVQHDSAVVKESFSTSTASGDPGNSAQNGAAGGLVGFVLSGLVQDSYAAGNVTGGNVTGGFAGEIQGGTVNNCYTNGSVAGTSAKGFVGGKSGGMVSGCFYNSDTGLSDPAATGKSAAEMRRQATFIPWDFATVWKIGDDISTPSLQWQEPWTDDEIIGMDLAALQWDDIRGENINTNFVTGNLAQLPVTGLKGAAITWSADPTGYIDNATGTLIKREETEDVTVTLTAEASYGTGAARTKAFVLTVKKLELDRYAVVYDANGGMGTSPMESDKAENEPFQAAAADSMQPPEAMRFKEWNTAANGTGTGYEAGATVTMPGNALTLYAIWEIVWIGNGSSQSPFQVPSAAHLDAARQNMGAHYILTADIDLPASGYTNWAPIGTNSNMFTGFFNGNSKSITGLTIDRGGTDYQGLFGAIGSGGLVKNLGLADVSVTGNNYVGGVAGQISGGNVESCYVSGSVRGAGYVGGIVGRFGTGEVRNCYSASDVSGSGSNIGGVAGQIQNGQMFLCYATGSVSGNSFAGGVAGRMLNEGIVMLCAALNPRVTAVSSGSRVINVPGTRTDDNYAFSGMTVTVNGAAKAIKAGVRLADGENLSFDSLFGESFWKDTLFFNTSTIWLIGDYKLPVLRNLAGQGGAPPHLIKIFVDRAKNAAESAAYSDIAQAVATGEAAIANALKSEAEAAVNNSSVTVTIDKVGYTPPVAGDSANPDGTDGSFVFTVTVARDSQNQTTAQKTITIMATLYTGVTDVQAVDAAKAALTDGSVNVDFVASQDDKTEAVQGYVNGLLSAVPNAAGVTANVTYNSTTGQYDVALSKGSVTGSMSLTMTVNEAPDPDIATVDNAKTAAENAEYSDMTQAAASSEDAIKAALRNTAVTAVNNGSVNVTVNKVSYLAPVAGTSANPSGTNGSYTFTVTVSKGSQSQTTTQKTIAVTATYKNTGGGSSDDDGNGDDSFGGSTPSTPAAPKYNAEVKAKNGTGTTLPVTVDKDAGTASVDAGSHDLDQDGTVITLPTVPDVNIYSVGIPVSSLSTADAQGTLTIDTDAGSVTVPSNMLTGVAGIRGSKAQISIGQGDKGTLPDDVKAAIGDRPLVQLTLSIDGKQTNWSNPNAPVTVSIPYTPTGLELANPESIVIWYIDGSGRAVSVPNGRYNPATGMVTFTTTHFSDYAVAYNKVSFNDVSTSAWYNKAVSFIAAREITSGTGNGNYSPEAKLTWVESIVLMMKAYGIAPDANPTDNFSDAGSAYYTGYLMAAKRLGLLAEVGNNMYAPDKEITRQEMFTLLYNALKVIGQLPEGDSGKTLGQFTDAGQIDLWAKDAMTLLVKNGTVGGSNGALTPLSTATRAEMAQVLYNLLGK